MNNNENIKVTVRNLLPGDVTYAGTVQGVPYTLTRTMKGKKCVQVVKDGQRREMTWNANTVLSVTR